MTGRKRQPAKQSNKDDAGATTGRPGSPRDDSQFVEQPGRREHVTGTTLPTAPKKR